MWTRLRPPIAVAALTVTLATAGQTASHLWVINEIFSSSDGSVQFVEMHVPLDAPAETFMANKWVQSTTTGNQFIFPANLSGNTSFAFLLLGTQAFADLPGAPTPDHIIPEGFFDLDADTILWWSYGTGDLSFLSGELPLDGTSSLDRDGTTGVNSPTNFAGETGSVDAGTVSIPSDAAAYPLSLRVLGASTQRGPIVVEFSLPGEAIATLDVFDAAGRAVRRLHDGRASGLVRLTWDGSSAGGEPVGNGVYLLRLEAGGRTAVRKALILR